MTKRMLLLISICLAAGAASAEPLIDGDAKAGAELSGTCVACHGADGNSANPVWPKIAGQNAPFLFQQLQLFKNGKRVNAIMAGQVANLSEQDMRDLAVFYAQQKTKAGVASEDQVELGETIYRGGIPDEGVPACSGCHGPAGQGNPTALYPSLAGQHAKYVEIQLKAYRSGQRNGYRQGKIMGGVAEKLSDEDITALSSYVEGLRPRAAAE